MRAMDFRWGKSMASISSLPRSGSRSKTKLILWPEFFQAVFIRSASAAISDSSVPGAVWSGFSSISFRAPLISKTER
ncbi:Uncharacterised protein [Shigella sonnei]|nr:Uncharacterised protein [Shigella sonnei]